MSGEYSTMQSIHFKLPSPSTPSSFIRFSLAAETPAELLEALKAKLLTYDINTDSVGYIDADGDVCQLKTVEDLESAVEHLETSAIILNVGERAKKAGKESKKTSEGRKRGRRDGSSSSSTSSSSSSDSDSDVLIVELEGGEPGKKCKKGMKKRAKMMRKLHKHGMCGRKGGPRHLPFGAPFGGPFGGRPPGVPLEGPPGVPLGSPIGRLHRHAFRHGYDSRRHGGLSGHFGWRRSLHRPAEAAISLMPFGERGCRVGEGRASSSGWSCVGGGNARVGKSFEI